MISSPNTRCYGRGGQVAWKLSQKDKMKFRVKKMLVKHAAELPRYTT